MKQTDNYAYTRLQTPIEDTNEVWHFSERALVRLTSMYFVFGFICGGVFCVGAFVLGASL